MFGQAHLSMPDGKTELNYDAECLHIDRHGNSRLVAFSSSLTVWFLNFALKILSANQIA